MAIICFEERLLCRQNNAGSNHKRHNQVKGRAQATKRWVECNWPVLWTWLQWYPYPHTSTFSHVSDVLHHLPLASQKLYKYTYITFWLIHHLPDVKNKVFKLSETALPNVFVCDNESFAEGLRCVEPNSGVLFHSRGDLPCDWSRACVQSTGNSR